MESLIGFLRQFGQLFQWWVTIAPWDAGLRVRCGRWMTDLGPGMHLRLPFLDAVYVQSVRLRYVNLPTQTVVAHDGRTLTFSAVLGYTIDDIRQLYRTLHHAQDTLQNFALQALAECATEPRAQRALTPANLSREATARLNLRQYGIGATDVRVTDFAFVRTYRLISDTRWGNYGDSLDMQAKR